MSATSPLASTTANHCLQFSETFVMITHNYFFYHRPYALEVATIFQHGKRKLLFIKKRFCVTGTEFWNAAMLMSSERDLIITAIYFTDFLFWAKLVEPKIMTARFSNLDLRFFENREEVLGIEPPCQQLSVIPRCFLLTTCRKQQQQQHTRTHTHTLDWTMLIGSNSS